MKNQKRPALREDIRLSSVEDQSESNGFVSIIILIILALAVGGYFAYQNFQLKMSAPSASTSSSPTAITAPTENWKIYTDKTLGFSLENPPNWFLKEGDKSLTKFKGESATTLANTKDAITSRVISVGEGKITIDKYKRLEEGLENL